jgi:hypothetical protein
VNSVAIWPRSTVGRTPADNAAPVPVCRIGAAAGKSIAGALYDDPTSWTNSTSIHLELDGPSGTALRSRDYPAATPPGTTVAGLAPKTGWYTDLTGPESQPRSALPNAGCRAANAPADLLPSARAPSRFRSTDSQAPAARALDRPARAARLSLSVPPSTIHRGAGRLRVCVHRFAVRVHRRSRTPAGSTPPLCSSLREESNRSWCADPPFGSGQRKRDRLIAVTAGAGIPLTSHRSTDVFLPGAVRYLTAGL